jgi:hypothetical protein
VLAGGCFSRPNPAFQRLDAADPGPTAQEIDAGGDPVARPVADATTPGALDAGQDSGPAIDSPPAPDAGTDRSPDAGDASPAGSSVSGTVKGKTFPVTVTYWIGKPAAGGFPTKVYLLEVSRSCSEISAPLWDKLAGTKQILEMAVKGTTTGVYPLNTQANANYLLGTSNPSASGGSVDVKTLNPAQDIRGSFTLTFGVDTLNGTFRAVYCASGVEP